MGPSGPGLGLAASPPSRYGAAVTRRGLARTWFGLTALVVVVGLAVQLVVTGRTTGGFYPSNPQRLFNTFAYFTVQSNVLVGLTSLWLALRPEPGSALQRTLRLAGLVGIAVTGVVFHVALRQLQDLKGAAATADLLLHTASPLLCVIGWLLLGPRGGLGRRIVLWSLAFPLAWLAFTLIRGPLVGFWPYPFLDVDVLGWGRVLLNCALVAVLFTGLAAGASRLDRALPGIRRSS